MQAVAFLYVPSLRVKSGIMYPYYPVFRMVINPLVANYIHAFILGWTTIVLTILYRTYRFPTDKSIRRFPGGSLDVVGYLRGAARDAGGLGISSAKNQQNAALIMWG